MIDQNTIIDLVTNSLPFISSSAVLVKLLDVIEKVLKALYMPTLTLKVGKAKVDVKMYEKQKDNQIIQNQTFTLDEVLKLKNFISTVNYAKEELIKTDECEGTETDIDFDWLIRFFDAVGHVSNKELQKLWGKVLAGEINHPGSCSLRTLDIIHNMSQSEAETFNKLCKYVMQSGNSFFIFNNGFNRKDEMNQESYCFISQAGLNYTEHIRPMLECNLIAADNDLVMDFKEDTVYIANNAKLICIIVSDESKERDIILDTYFLTTSGKELYSIIESMSDFEPDTDYALLCFKELKERHSELNISAHKILGHDEYAEENLLQ